MQLVWWFAGVLATLAGIKFVFAVFRKLTSKEQIDNLMQKANDGIHNTSERVAYYIKQRKEEKDNRPRVTIR